MTNKRLLFNITLIILLIGLTTISATDTDTEGEFSTVTQNNQIEQTTPTDYNSNNQQTTTDTELSQTTAKTTENNNTNMEDKHAYYTIDDELKENRETPEKDHDYDDDETDNITYMPYIEDDHEITYNAMDNEPDDKYDYAKIDENEEAADGNYTIETRIENDENFINNNKNMEDKNTNNSSGEEEKTASLQMENIIPQPLQTTIYKINSKSSKLNENTQFPNTPQMNINSNADKIIGSSIFKNENKVPENNRLSVNEKISPDNIISENITEDGTMEEETILTKFLDLLQMICDCLNICHV